MKRVLLAASLAVMLAGIGVLVSRAQHATVTRDPLAEFRSALARHDYTAAYALTDLADTVVPASSSAITLAHFSVFERAHPTTDPTLVRNVVHIPITVLGITATTGPLPSLSVDRLRVPLRPMRVPTNAPRVAAWRYRYVIVVISGPHDLAIGEGRVTRARQMQITATRSSQNLTVALQASARGGDLVVAALRAIVGTCPGDSCVVTPCSGSGSEYVLDAWGIGTPPVVARALVGDRVVAPMPPDGWSIAITFVDQAQPPGLSGHEQTRSLRARFVF
ncbi:MAG: hypothetical protein ACXVQW_12950, partial [Actinomycetota bacterium]